MKIQSSTLGTLASNAPRTGINNLMPLSAAHARIKEISALLGIDVTASPNLIAANVQVRELEESLVAIEAATTAPPTPAAGAIAPADTNLRGRARFVAAGLRAQSATPPSPEVAAGLTGRDRFRAAQVHSHTTATPIAGAQANAEQAIDPKLKGRDRFRAAGILANRKTV